MKINLTIVQKHILQLILLIVIGLLCDAFIFATISTIYIPETGWGEHHYIKIVALYRHFFGQFLAPHIGIVTLIISTLFLLLFKIVLFPKTIIKIESAKDKTRCSEIIRGIHKNKFYLLGCFIIFCLLSLSFLEGYSDIYGLNCKYTYLLVIPMHYLAIYLYWLYDDIKNTKQAKILYDYNKKDIPIELIKYILITNPVFILLSWFALLSILLNKFPIFEIFIIVIFVLLLASLILFYLYFAIKLLVKGAIYVINNLRNAKYSK